MDWVAPGTVLAGKYALESKLGQGGMGAVWRAEHVQLRSPVAIKLIDEQIVANPDALARFMREAQAAAALRSPHVVQILDFGTDRGVPFIAMELLDGESLAQRLERVGRLSPAEVVRLVTQIARALGKAHELGIVHRDIKPDNVFIVKNDEEEIAKVLDFGIAKSTPGIGVASGSATRTGAILGTPHYMSPEQAEGTKHVDHRTDVWALGVIVFECLIGKRPFDSDALGSLLLAICTRPLPVPSQWGCQLPGFDAWFARACARELGDRFQSVRELALELRRIVGVSGTEETLVSDLSLGARLAPLSATAGATTPFAGASPTGTPYTTPARPASRGHPISRWLLFGTLLAVAIAAAVAFTVRKNRGEANLTVTSPPAAAPPTAPHTIAEPAVHAPSVVDPGSPPSAGAVAAAASAVGPLASASPGLAVAAPVRHSATPKSHRPGQGADKPAASAAPKTPGQGGKVDLGI